MKFANIDEAITEAAKKAVPQKAVKAAPKMPTKAAPKKAEVAKGKKAPVAPAKKPVAPKKAEAPAAPKKKEVAPAPAPAKKAEKKKPAAAKPAPQKKKEEPKKQPEQKPVQPWSTKGREARAKQLASMSPEEKERESEKSKRKMGLTPASRGIGDRLKSAWKAFTAKPGSSVDIKKSYKSVFHEIQKLMEQLQLVESMLREQSLNESYDASAVNNLYAHRNAIRGVLVEQMIREELYKHNVTVAELTKQERTALMETVNVRANSVWEQLAEIDNTDDEDQDYDPNSHATSADYTEWPSSQHDDEGYYDDTDQSDYEENEAVVIQPTGELAKILDKLKHTPTHKTKTSQHARVMEKPKVNTKVNTKEKQMEEGNKENRAKKNATVMAAGQRRIAVGNTRSGAEFQLPADQLRAGRDEFMPYQGSQQELDKFYRDTEADEERFRDAPMEEQYTIEEWMGMMAEAGYSNEEEMEEGKLSRLAAGLGLAGAAMMGGAQDAGAQSAAPAQPQRTVQSFTMQRGADGNQVAVDAQGKPVKMQHTPADSVSTQKSRDMQMAVNKAEFDLRSKGIDPMASRDGKRVFKRDIVQNPDGTYTAKISPDRGESPMEESYTLEEWVGMLEEAGYSL